MILHSNEPPKGSKDLTPFYTIFIVAIILIGSFMVTLNNDNDDDDESNDGPVTINPDEVKYRSTETVRLWPPYPTSTEYQDIDDVQIDGNFDYHAILLSLDDDTENDYLSIISPSVVESFFVWLVGKPFKDDRNDHNFITSNGIEKSPSFREIQFPEIINSVSLDVAIWDLTFRNLDPAKCVF